LDRLDFFFDAGLRFLFGGFGFGGSNSAIA